MDPTVLFAASLAFVAVVAMGLVFAGVGSGSSKAAKRVQAVVQKGKGGRQAMRPAANASAEQRRKQLQRNLQEQEKKRRAAAFDAGAKLREAGLAMEAKTFWMVAAIFGLVAAMVALLVHLQPLVILMIGFVAGAGLPLWFIGMLAKRRRAKFAMAFADAVDIIVRGMRSCIFSRA